MCQAIPHRIVSVEGDRALVDEAGREHWIRLAEHLRDARAGEYVSVYAATAIARIDAAEAEEQLRFLRELEERFPADGEDT